MKKNHIIFILFLILLMPACQPENVDDLKNDDEQSQQDFVTDRTPRIENWLQPVIYTETTPGLQVSRETDINADGSFAEGVTTFGFYFVETGNFCRISAKGDFSTRGVYQEGKIAISQSGKTEYYLCDRLEVRKVYDQHVWIVATCKDLPEIRIVTEVF